MVRLSRLRPRAGFAAACSPLALVLLSCSPPPNEGSSGVEQSSIVSAPTPRVPFEEAFQVKRSIVLEENDEVINVTPSLTADPDGGFLIADMREHRVRRYSESGQLVWQFGRAGPGPEEFGAVQAALRIPDGRIMIAELSRKVVLLDEETQAVSEVFPTFSEGMIEELDLLPDGRVLVSGRWNYADPEQGIVSVADPQTGRIDTSFFVPKVPEFLQLGAARAGWATSDIRGDTIATMFAWADTVYLQGLDGALIEKIPVPPSSFVFATEDPEGFESPAVWMRAHSRFQDLEWLPDGRFLIQYGGATHGVTPSDPLARYHILLVDRRGRGLAEVVDGPRLRMVGDDGEIYFSDPAFLEGNRMVVVSPSAEYPQ